MLALNLGDTPLIHAVRHGHVGVVAAMLAEGGYGVDEPMTNGNGATPLYASQSRPIYGRRDAACCEC